MILSWVNVPVLSVQSTSTAPKFWIELIFLITVPFFAILEAPLTRLVVTIIGSISGVNPTATDKPNRKASIQSPLVSPLITMTVGAMIAINLIKMNEVFLIPNSKFVKSGLVLKDFATSPNNVRFPVAITTPSALPLMTLLPIKTIFS